MRFVIFGTGAVGGYIGARLSQGGHPVRFLARPDWVNALRGRGLRLIEDPPPRRFPFCKHRADLAEIIDQVEVVLLCVKAYDAQTSAAELSRLLPPAVPVVSLLNGIGGEEILVQALGLPRVLEASLTTAVHVLEPGVIRLERERGLGLGSNHPMAPALAAAFRASGIRTRLYRSARAMKWSKLLTNMAGNVSSAILGWTAAKVMEPPGVFHSGSRGLARGGTRDARLRLAAPFVARRPRPPAGAGPAPADPLAAAGARTDRESRARPEAPLSSRRPRARAIGGLLDERRRARARPACRSSDADERRPDGDLRRPGARSDTSRKRSAIAPDSCWITPARAGVPGAARYNRPR